MVDHHLPPNATSRQVGQHDAMWLRSDADKAGTECLQHTDRVVHSNGPGQQSQRGPSRRAQERLQSGGLRCGASRPCA